MSNHEYEQGDLLLPSAAFSKLRRHVCEGYNAWQSHCFTVAQTVHTQVSAALKGQRLPDVTRAVHAAIDRIAQQEDPGSALGHYSLSRPTVARAYRPRLGEEGQMLLQQMLLKTDPTSRKVSLRRPLKKDFPTVPLTHGAFAVGEVSLRFDATARRVHWQVGENNHAVERAWREVLGEVFAQGLSQVSWTRGTGGTFLYNNEYNRDAGRDYEGGGGTMVSRRFGPLGEDPMMARARQAAARKPGLRR